MFQIIVKIIGLVMILVGVTLIYDARILTKRFFSFGDQNDASSGLKILGFILSMLGAIIIYFLFI